jgi:hypothetical protein
MRVVGREADAASRPHSEPRHHQMARGRTCQFPQSQQMYNVRRCDAAFRATSFNDIIGGYEQRSRYNKAERLGGFELDDKIEFGRLFDWDYRRASSHAVFIDQVGGAPKQVVFKS